MTNQCGAEGLPRQGGVMDKEGRGEARVSTFFLQCGDCGKGAQGGAKKLDGISILSETKDLGGTGRGCG